MATYECSECGMAVNATCAKCDAPLVNDLLKLEDGSEVQVSKCPNDHGKIKSPLCCGQDMTCTVWHKGIALFPKLINHDAVIWFTKLFCILIGLYTV